MQECYGGETIHHFQTAGDVFSYLFPLIKSKPFHHCMKLKIDLNVGYLQQILCCLEKSSRYLTKHSNGLRHVSPVCGIHIINVYHIFIHV